MERNFWIIYLGKVEHENKSQKSMGRGEWGKRKEFVLIFTFTADVCKIKFSTILILLHNKGFVIPMYKPTSRSLTGFVCCAVCMFFLLVERPLSFMQWCFLQPHSASLLGCKCWNRVYSFANLCCKNTTSNIEVNYFT